VNSTLNPVLRTHSHFICLRPERLHHLTMSVVQWFFLISTKEHLIMLGVDCHAVHHRRPFSG
jgi:hypothetical protein